MMANCCHLCKLSYIGCLAIVLTLYGVRTSTPHISHVSNYVKLVSSYYLSGYSVKDFIPLNDLSQTMLVSLDIALYAINDFEEVSGMIEIVAAVRMKWRDETPSINAITFVIADRQFLVMPYDAIWTPRLILTSAVGDASVVGGSAFMCRFDMRTNDVTWNPRVVVSSACSPDVTFYPFDKQTCSFVYTPWGFSDTELTLNATANEWDQSEFETNGEWSVFSTSTEAYIANNSSYIKLSLSIVRKPMYVIINILAPVLLLCMLNSVVFLLPAESGERVGFSVTCFLSFIVLLNMIMDVLPKSSDPISFLSFYLVLMMCMSGAMTVVTVLMMRVYHKPEKAEVPKWLQRTVTFINCGCTRLVCCVKCFRCIRRSIRQCVNTSRNCFCRPKTGNKSNNSIGIETVGDDECSERNQHDKQTQAGRETSLAQAIRQKFTTFGTCISNIIRGLETEVAEMQIPKEEQENPNKSAEVFDKDDDTKAKSSPCKTDVVSEIALHPNDCQRNSIKSDLQRRGKTLKTKTVKVTRGLSVNGDTHTSENTWTMTLDTLTENAHKVEEDKKEPIKVVRQDKHDLEPNEEETETEQYGSGIVLTDEYDSDETSFSNIEEEVTWQEVGRVLDTFFFIAFLAAELFFTVVFLVPIATSNNE